MGAKASNKSALVVIAVAAVMVPYFAFLSGKDVALQRQRGPAMIERVQQEFTPSQKLMAMHPLGEFQWIATRNPVDCTFQRPRIQNCWEVYFGARVVGPDPLGRSPGKVEANFIVNGKTMRVMPVGREVLTFFDRKSPDQQQGQTGDAVQGQSSKTSASPPALTDRRGQLPPARSAAPVSRRRSPLPGSPEIPHPLPRRNPENPA